MKWIGILCICIACSGLGFNLSSAYKKRIRVLTEIGDMIHSLGEYVEHVVPLGEGLERVKMRADEKYRPFLTRVCFQIEKNEGDNLGQIWKDNAVMLKNIIDKRDYNSFEECMKQTGFLDERSQKMALAGYEQILDENIKKLKDEQKDKCKLYQTIGILSGLFICVLLI